MSSDLAAADTEFQAWKVVHLLAQGPCGETVLDPVFAELLCVSRWRQQLPLHFEGSRYPTLGRALGPLPAALLPAAPNSRRLRPTRRDELLAALARLDPEGYGAPLGGDDEAFVSLLDLCIGPAITDLLYNDRSIWEDYTRPTLVRSAPSGYGWVHAWAERRRQQRELRGRLGGIRSLDSSVALGLGLRSALEALAERLGSADSFGSKSSSSSSEVTALSALDAKAYGHLVVLFSIPCERGSSLQQILSDFPSLARFCGWLEERLSGIWPDYGSFLSALPPDERPPPPPPTASSAGRRAASEIAIQATPRRDWWEIWGWSWAGQRRPVQFGGPGKKPPAWHMPIFGVAAAFSIAVASLLGLGPQLPGRTLMDALQWVAGSSSHESGDEPDTPE
ncbi:unnamed protein product [Polarella glacialis]|uniref:Uncharacterized protein n=1 Tax=Polarella glacialis TaxID=89957 RepID=A0A813JGF5_POLGL|nr:unnamed protein product [Polarella glacialis]